MTDSKLLSRNEAAEHLGISTVSLDRFVVTGELEPLYIGRRVLFEPHAIEDFISSQRENVRHQYCGR